MKIILSPSKTQADKPLNQNVDKTQFAKAIKLFKQLQKLSKNDVAQLFKIKGALLDQTYDLYHRFAESNLGIKAIDCYKGVVFEQINHQDLNQKQQNYLDSHLVILSAMYGVLEPRDAMWPYRLDMGHKPNNTNLYQYWQEDIDDYFRDEDCIINLASLEFSKMLKSQPMINIHFLDQDAGRKLKVIGFNAKKARGKMTNLLINQTITHPEDIKEITFDGYRYDAAMSDSNNYYFIKRYQNTEE